MKKEELLKIINRAIKSCKSSATILEGFRNKIEVSGDGSVAGLEDFLRLSIKQDEEMLEKQRDLLVMSFPSIKKFKIITDE